MPTSAPFELIDWRLNELVYRADCLPLMQSPLGTGSFPAGMRRSSARPDAVYNGEISGQIEQRSLYGRHFERRPLRECCGGRRANSR